MRFFNRNSHGNRKNQPGHRSLRQIRDFYLQLQAKLERENIKNKMTKEAFFGPATELQDGVRVHETDIHAAQRDTQLPADVPIADSKAVLPSDADGSECGGTVELP